MRNEEALCDLAEKLDRESKTNGDHTPLFKRLLAEYNDLEDETYQDAMAADFLSEAFGPGETTFDAGGL